MINSPPYRELYLSMKEHVAASVSWFDDFVDWKAVQNQIISSGLRTLVYSVLSNFDLILTSPRSTSPKTNLQTKSDFKSAGKIDGQRQLPPGSETFIEDTKLRLEDFAKAVAGDVLKKIGKRAGFKIAMQYIDNHLSSVSYLIMGGKKLIKIKKIKSRADKYGWGNECTRVVLIYLAKTGLAFLCPAMLIRAPIKGALYFIIDMSMHNLVGYVISPWPSLTYLKRCLSSVLYSFV